uniref:Secreted frizzled-related protein 2-like n=1 Tax=Erpetoichthys calabaricus TaxID=27687 RepID=A0A8C4X605_ERPCA
MDLLPLRVSLVLLLWTLSAVASTFPFAVSYYSPKRPACRAIPSTMALCHDVGYTEMRLPNLLGHDTLKEAQHQASSWVPLVSKRCHKDTKRFLCSLFAPVCLVEFVEPLPPCRSLCEVVRDGCVPVMSAFGFPWPEMFNCSQFPPGNEMCIPGTTMGSKGMDDKLDEHAKMPRCDACRPFGDVEKEMQQNFCQHDFMVKLKVKESHINGGNRKVVPEGPSHVILKRLNRVEEEEINRKAFLLPKGATCTCGELLEPSTTLLALGRRAGNKLLLNRIMGWHTGDGELKRILQGVRKLQC